MPTYGAPPVMFVRGEGTRLWDAEGNEYLDFLAGLAVTSLGHAHPAVTEAISEQAGKLVHVSNLFATEHNWAVAQALDRLIRGDEGATRAVTEAPVGGAKAPSHGGSVPTAGGRGDEGAEQPQQRGQVFFCNSGAEANEAAIKLARKWGGHGKFVVVSAMRSFHGRTLATLHATGQPEKHEAFQPLPEGFRHVPYNDIDELERSLDPSVAAVLLEAVQGEGGVNPIDPAYARDVRRLCDERQLLLMFDEVQTGLGRTGEWFGYQHTGVEPDVVTLAKALGNGVPIGACWARADVAAAFQPGDHATTFGGQPLATAAARAVLRVMEDIDAPRLAADQGAKLRTALLGLPAVTGVRGLGLLLAAEFEGIDARALAAAALEAGLVVNGITPTALRLAPPLTVSDDEIEQAVSIIGELT
jgi:acetylornithine/succinyldiaminopimelate/putrescine aminotransferase